MYDKLIKPPTQEYLTSHVRYESTITFDDEVIYVFSLTDDEIRGVIQPFIDGKYSLISRDWVSKYYPPIPSHARYTQRRVCDKADSLRLYWEDYLDAELPPNAEVWFTPSPKHYIYAHRETTEHLQ